jgi:hypothetical protein
MKKLSLLLIIMVTAIYGFSQSISIISGATEIWCTDTSSCSITATIKNISGTTKTVKCKRTIISMSQGNTNYFCFAGTCYSPPTRVSGSSAIMAPDSTNSSFIGYLSDSASTCDDTVSYCFFNVNDTLDETCFTVVYHFRPTGISQVLPANTTMLSVYPNPVDFEATFQYSLPKDINSATVTVMNMLGNKVGEYELDISKNKAVISTADLSNGIYFYSLEVDGRVISTKKMMVSHQ